MFIVVAALPKQNSFKECEFQNGLEYKLIVSLKKAHVESGNP